MTTIHLVHLVTNKFFHCIVAFLFFKGAIQELKLYGMPGVAEVQCDDSLSVCNPFLIFLVQIFRT